MIIQNIKNQTHGYWPGPCDHVWSFLKQFLTWKQFVRHFEDSKAFNLQKKTWIFMNYIHGLLNQFSILGAQQCTLWFEKCLQVDISGSEGSGWDLQGNVLKTKVSVLGLYGFSHMLYSVCVRERHTQRECVWEREFVCVCLFVCVCVWERETEKERESCSLTQLPIF